MAGKGERLTHWDQTLRLRRAGRPAEALQALELDLVDSGTQPTAKIRRLRASLLLELARAARSEGDTAAALGHLDRARTDGSFPDLCYERGLVQLALGDREAARASFAEALSLAPRYALAGLELALLEARDGQIAEALARLRRLTDGVTPEQKQRLTEGAERLRAGAWEEAEARVRDSFRESAAAMQGSFREFGRLLEEGDPMRALEAARQLVERYPSYADAQHALGLAYLALGWCDDAIAAFGRALERNPDYDESRVYLAWTLFTQGETRDGDAELTRLLEASPGYQPALRLREVRLNGRVRPATSQSAAAARA
jgi:tetratricopeptide (TPR) repeat protein